MKRLIIFLFITCLFSIDSANAAFRYNVVQSCGPIQYCFEGNSQSSRDSCIQGIASCQAAGGQTSICYYAESCTGEVPDPGTVGPINPPLTPQPGDICITIPDLCTDGQPDPCKVNPTADDCPQPEVYEAPEAYEITSRIKNPLQSNNVFELLRKLYLSLIHI